MKRVRTAVIAAWGLAALFSSAWAQQPASPAPAGGPRFEISRYQVEGATLFPPASIERLVAPFTGKGRTFADVQQALDAIEAAYREKGYGAVRVVLPEQELSAGVVRLRVVEGRVSKVTVQGAKFRDEANVRGSLPALKEGSVPNLLDAARQTQLGNENPSRRNTISLRAGEQEGDVEVSVNVDDSKPVKYFAYMDNTGTPATGRYRVGAGFQNSNFRNQDEILTFQYVTSPEREYAFDKVNIFGLGYRLPFYDWNGAADFVFGYSDVDSGTVENLFNVSGSGTIFAARYTHYLRRPRPDYEHKASIAWDYREYRNNVSLINAPGSLLPDYTVQPLSLTYSGAARLPETSMSVYASYAHNLPGGVDGTGSDFDLVRPGASAHYDIIRYGLSMATVLNKQDWQARGELNGQYTPDALLPGEQFGVGGAQSVRGFFEREVANDMGRRLNLEIYTPDFGKQVGQGTKVRALAFYDHAYTKRVEALPGEQVRESISSFGAGVRIGIGDWSLRFDVARVLDPGGTQTSGDSKLHGSVAYVFQ